MAGAFYQSLNMAKSMPINSLYIHVPFCCTKCGYCAFYSMPGCGPEQIDSYLNCLMQDLDKAARICGVLDSIYIGGGTPTVLDEQQLQILLGAIHQRFADSKNCEFTVECNPDSLTAEKLDVLCSHGVNRISLGIQSFSARLLQTLGRVTPDGSVRNALDALTTSGLRNFGIDLIYGIPGQSLDDWVNDIDRACSCGISHLSTYALTIEEQSRLAGADIELPDDDLVVEMWDATAETVGKYGLERYEVSNYAVPGRECRHNMDIWHGAAYSGCGPAAASFDGETRWTQPADLDAWQRHVPPEIDDLPPERRAAEILAFGLRTVRGWGCEEFRARTGRDLRSVRGDTIERLCGEGLLAWAGDRVYPTREGLLFADYVAAEIL